MITQYINNPCCQVGQKIEILWNGNVMVTHLLWWNVVSSGTKINSCVGINAGKDEENAWKAIRRRHKKAAIYFCSDSSVILKLRTEI